ncbi:hypothetical protein Aperf_G00000112278 [Anoplocephala perfoliata]
MINVFTKNHRLDKPSVQALSTINTTNYYKSLDISVLVHQTALSISLTVEMETKWKRQTAVGLELLAESGNFMAVKRILQTSPYWAFHPATESILANMETIAKQQASHSNNCYTTISSSSSLATNLSSITPMVNSLSQTLENDVKSVILHDPTRVDDALRQFLESLLSSSTANSLTMPLLPSTNQWLGPIMSSSSQSFC